MPARRRPPGVRLGLDRRSGPVGSAFLVDVADDILAIDCDSADRVEVVQEIATELQGHGYRPFGLLPVGPVTNICSSPSFVERQAGRPRTTERTSQSNPESAHAGKIPEMPKSIEEVGGSRSRPRIENPGERVHDILSRHLAA